MSADTNHHTLVDQPYLHFLNPAPHGSPLLEDNHYPAGHGLIPTPESTTAAAESPMESHVESDKAIPESHVCPECGKQFPRNCDLNKHAKSHTRPFKCSVKNCKYYHLGWPTAKELDRHVNDKHSLSPLTFPCRYQDCSYRSKRESNCKQHMEKAHGWLYVKSKTNGKRADDEPDRQLFKPEPGLATPVVESINPYPTPQSEQQPVFGKPAEMDFVLFPPSETDDEDVLDGISPDGSQSYLPWTSPMTRLRKTQTFLEEFSEAYNSSSGKPDQTPDGLIDPQLADAMHIDVPLQRFGAGASILPGVSLRKPALPVVSMAQAEFPSPLLSEGSCSVPPHASLKRKREIGVVSTPAGSTGAIPYRHRRAISGSSSQSKQLIRSTARPPPTEREEDSDEEEVKPPKKKKRASDDAFGDNNMPDIFRFAHPEIYNRDKKEKYSPCHSDHKDISTLVRHLSRPAHRLRVTDRLVSSFEIEEDDYPHPRVGICRRCWTAYPGRQEFEDHVAGNCTKVSKGKKEKWNILFLAFTPLVGEHEDRLAPPRHLGVDDASEDAESIPASAASPTTIELGIVRDDLDDDAAWVPMAQYRQLAEENNRYKLILTTLAQHPHFGGQTGFAEQVAAVVGPQHHHLLTNGAERVEGIDTEPEQYHHHDVPSDRASLVGYMDSQSTDVDPHGLMEDVKTLSRANSGIGESEMRLKKPHHVPTEDVESVRDGATDGTQAPHPHPTSIADSGYHTHSKRPSFTQEEISAQLEAARVANFMAGMDRATSSAPTVTATQHLQLPHQMGAYPHQDNYSFLPGGQVSGLPMMHEHEHRSLKATGTVNNPILADEMWMMRDPFAGAGSSQAASQAASLANLGQFDGAHGVEDPAVYFNDLVDFDP
ncbi:hypothetical protein GQ53DRAFT_839255 [Thozetella sp. PMI_491]|nr:hypothetical protein GQ53DRAFT_839255 [Thozetella sp. PMI_491]